MSADLADIEAKLRLPDAILEEATLENDARLFVSNGGEPEVSASSLD
jgi:hypothetical protein